MRTMRDVLLAALAMTLLAPALAVAQEAAMPDTMLAAALERGGGPEVLQSHRLPVPKPVHSCSFFGRHCDSTGTNCPRDLGGPYLSSDQTAP
jgi:hypothetical protein